MKMVDSTLFEGWRKLWSDVLQGGEGADAHCEREAGHSWGCEESS